jgi:serine protease inhibitor
MPTEAERPYYDRLNQVGISLLKEHSASGNFAFSPVGVGHNLAVLMNGSSGKSRDELLALFDLTESNLGAFNTAQRALLNKLQPSGVSPFVSGTGVFSVWPVRFDEGYVEKMGKTYSAVVRKLGGATLEGERLLHVWVEERIAHDFGSPQIRLTTQQQILSISCAGYFWAGVASSPPVEPVVTRGRRADSEFVSIDLRDGYRLVALMPSDGESVDEFIERTEVDSFLGDSGDAVVPSPSIPEINISSETDLRAALRSVGVSTLFGPGANLRAMSIETESGYRISEAIHKVIVYVPETKGTDPVLHVPYVFAVMEKETGVMVAVGVVRS